MEIIPHPSSLSSNDKKYDVFLSFRGIDTRNRFTAHLHKYLKEANIETFLDEDEIEPGLQLKPELENAIKASRASIIVLSENYASSTWCLEELTLILHQNRTTNHFVLPVFYNVEPTNVRKQEGSFGDAMAKHKQRMENETNAEKKDQLAQKIEIWGNALTEVADLKGRKDAAGRRETELIEEIITDIHRNLGVLLKCNLPVLIGMDSHISFITSWLKDGSNHNADILTILGMGGIGKTSLAKYIYWKHCHLFERSSFIANIKSEKILDLQKKIVSNISKPSSVHVHDDSDYTSMIENALKGKKVLLVLDDVDDVEQLNKLLGNGGCHPGSKIIITTQVASLTKKFKTHKLTVQPKNTVRVLEGLNDKASLQLLTLHASTCNSLKAGYNEVSKKLVTYCEGHPGALKQMGKSLCDLGVTEWQEYIDLLKTEMNDLIKKVLRMDVYSLRSENDKELFKHIASFFAGKDRGFAETILEACKIKTRIGINNLTDRCLVTIGSRNELRMHQLLQDMGRDLVRQESRTKLWKRSRLWCSEESYDVLQKKRGNKGNLQGIAFDWSVLKEEESYESLELETDALSKMENLMLLQLNYVKLNGSYNNFPKQIRWLCIHGFPTESIPADLPMGNLVVLDMSYSCIEFFDMSNCHGPRNTKKLTIPRSKENLLLGSLKILNLSFCRQLRTLGGFSQLPMLERLILASCRSLIEICETIGQCDDLLVIDLSYCTMLKRLPKSMFELKKLEALSLDGCNLYEIPIGMTDKDLSEILNFNRIRINSEAPSPITAVALPRDLMSFSICSESSLLPLLLLRHSNLCNESFPMAFSSVSMFEKLTLDGNPIVSLPNCVRSVRRIELLSKEEYDMLKTFEHPPCMLRHLKFERFNLLQKIAFNQQMSPVAKALAIYSLAHSCKEMEGIVKIQPIAHVEEDLLCTLGWNDLEFIKNKEVETWHDLRREKKSQVQLFYEYGIFSTFFGGKEIPHWIYYKSVGSTMSFTVPSSNQNLRGLNFCHMQTGRDSDDGVNLPTIIISNITKKHTWIYKHYIHWVKVDERCFIWLSHWMFGKKDMEVGDQVTITIPDEHEDVSANVSIGYSLVYDDGDMEVDPLGHYKKWKHIIGGDLSPFRLTSGQYFLDNHRFFLWHIDCPVNRPFIANGSSYEEKGVYFRSLSQRRFDMVGGALEDVME